MTAAKRFSVRELIPQQRIRTTDAVRRQGDAILSAIALGSREEQEFAARTGKMIGLNLGLRWVGDLQPVGAAVAQVVDALRRVKDQSKQRDALSAAVAELANYGNKLATSEAEAGGPSAALTFGTKRPEREFGPVTRRALVRNVGPAKHGRWQASRAGDACEHERECESVLGCTSETSTF